MTHLSLAGVIAQTRDVVEALEPCWQSASAESAGRWARDRRLLEIAGKARAARRERAWARDA